MFNMEKIGKTLSRLRKSRNMTQMELADKMNISFQAVSNWERGTSMPDISKLPELAQLFNVTIDMLLGETSDLLKSVANDNTDEFLENNNLVAEELTQIAPLLKPTQVDTILKGAKPPLEFSEVIDILPFISTDILNELAYKAAESESYEALGGIAPFADRSVINDIAKKMTSEHKSIAEIAPFVDRNLIGEFAMSSYEKNGLSSLDDFGPFIPKDTLRHIAEAEFAKHGLRHFESIAPFLNSAYLSGLAQKAIQKDGIKAISPIAPFLDKTMLSNYIKEKFL